MEDNASQPAFGFSEIHQGNNTENFLDLQPNTSPGLTKREYFAGLALQGLIASNREIQRYGYDSGVVGRGSTDYAKSSVAYADALLLELEKK